MMFVCTASKGLYSQAGTCFSAAAWMITSTPRVACCEALEVAHVAEQEAHALVVAEGAVRSRTA